MTTLQHVELGVLGPLQVRQYGLPVAVPGAKPRAVLIMLGLHGGSVVSANTLAELLWGADPPRTAAKALQTHISSLRRALGDGYVLTEGTGWTLNTGEIDATRYKLAARLGRDAVTAGDAGQAVTRFDEALSLWRGIPELPDGPRGGSEKTRWIEGHAALVEDRADALLATGRAAEIVGELEAAIADAPLRERRWGQLMLALYRAGRQGEALGAYQRARSMLADELGVDPGPDLRRLETAIVAQDAALEITVEEHLSVVTRAVTFLLTDIEGSTAAWEADADAMGVALARHDEVVEHVVTSRGGRLVKTRGEGDATFSVFDRPSSAAAAAIELQEAIRHEPWALAEPMRIRVALHTGEVELRDGDYFGRPVNRAARLRSLAAGGQVLCSGATAELVIDTLSDDVVLADLGMRHLRNLARPEHVFELRLETAEESADSTTTEPPMQRPALPAVLAGPGPFVGRGPELEGLLTAWQSTLAAGTRAVLIAGEPGVGKTRLAGEWSRQVYEDGAVVLYGRCDEDLGAAYQPFAEALRSLVPGLGTDRLRGMRGVEALVALVPVLTEVVPDLPMASRSDPDTERYALFDAVVALLTMASRNAPVVLILDDLHWATKPTLLLLRHLLRFGEHARVQIVGTYRSTDLDRSHPLAAMLTDLHRDGSASRLALSGLDEKDVSAYVSEAGYDDEELARALASVTGGNPFFLIEALRHVDESGGRWDPNTLPQGVREAVSRRLTRLPPETNKALAAAAVVGSRFAVDLVERVVDGDLVDAFDEACKAGIIIEEPGGRYRFNHALVRQSLLAELASVRRMRLHQKIATTLEAEPGADDELLAELAHHYFECAWAGNAAKAVQYCRRAADQAIERLAYEGAADLYDRALHALEELDEELPDRDAQQAQLLVARCEALLAAGDVGSAADAVAQLRRAAGDSVRLAAWGICFDGQLSMLTDPERLDEIESEVSAAARRLAELGDAAGEANAHTVRAACLARLGRIADCETALDQALTAARRARDHRRVNAVLAGAPLAALWGPNPVPRAGGRCLDVVRLLRITTGSPVVEATSTRCQGVLDAMRGRAAAGRQLIDSARRALTELGMRHALLEVEQFAGIVELVADDPAAAEPHLRRAHDGFRRMGLDADTAETAALLSRACLALDRDAEADELCREGERLAGHALKPSIAWRAVRAQLLARGGAHNEARRVAEEAVALAECTDALVDHGDACLALASVLAAAGEVAGARSAAEQAVALYERKGAAALVEKAQRVLGQRSPSMAEPPTETPSVAVAEMDAVYRDLEDADSRIPPENECVRVLRRLDDAYDRVAWDEVEQYVAAVVSLESRRKIVGQDPVDLPFSEWASEAKRFREMLAAVRYRHEVVAVRGERLALTSLEVGPTDQSPGAPRDELLQLYGIDEDGRIDLHMWFDIDDMDAAIAELDAAHARLAGVSARTPLENTATRIDDELIALFSDDRLDEIGPLFTENTRLDDRRHGLRRESDDRQTQVDNIRAIAALRVAVTKRTLAVRGNRLCLSKTRFQELATLPAAFHAEILEITDADSSGLIAAKVVFDLEDFDAAIAELEARYVAGEAAAHADTWSVIIAGAIEAINDAPDFKVYIESVHRLTDLGAVFTKVGQGSSHQGFNAEWRMIDLLTVNDGLLNRSELFDEVDLEAALAKFDELGRPKLRLENDASRVSKRFRTLFESRDWDGIAELYAEDVSADDRRAVFGGGTRSGRHAEIANLRAMVDLGAPRMNSVVLATRGRRLVLHETDVSNNDQWEASFLSVLEIDPDDRIVEVVGFDLDDVDAALAALDARYLAGEAARYADTWNLITRGYACLNRHEIPATTPDWVNIDHRRGTAFAPGDLIPFMHAAWDDTPDIRIHIAAVHRLEESAAVLTTATHGTSDGGFDAEWREVSVLVFDGDMVSRCELFDMADLDTAIARFDELSRPVPRLENAATRVIDRFTAHFAAHDWDILAELLADDVCDDDRRRVVNSAIQHGRDTQLANLRVIADVGVGSFDSVVIATRGERLALTRTKVTADGHPSDTFVLEPVSIAEINVDGQLAATIHFDDIEAAVAELDSRYLNGEAADHARTWAAIADGCTALNRQQLPSWSGFTYVDRRRIANIGGGDMRAFFRAAWELTPNMVTFVEVVHRLSDLGAVVSQVAQGTSDDGFYAEWRVTNVYMVEGNLVSRCEVFDEANLGSAIRRFDELERRATRLGNAASRVEERSLACFVARDWDSMAQLLADELSLDDRRRVVNAGTRYGRDAAIADARAIAELGGRQITSDVVATRGERLFLARTRLSSYDQPEVFDTESLCVAMIDAGGRIAARVVFDPDDIDAAFAELDARYVVGEAAPYVRTWSAVAGSYAALNRHEIPPRTSDWVNIDHRRGATVAPGDMLPHVQAAWELTPNISFHIETVHRLDDSGAVIGRTTFGTSEDGFDAEWRSVDLLTVDDGLTNRVEFFDETDVEAAIARFDELSVPTPRLENVATRVDIRAADAFNRRDLDSYLATFAANAQYDDRRKGLRNSGPIDRELAHGMLFTGAPSWQVEIAPLAIRGRHLALARHICRDSGEPASPVIAEVLALVEADDDELMCRNVLFDCDDVDAAFEEMDARYIADEAATHADLWSAVASTYAELNRHELLAWIQDVVHLDHRTVVTIDPNDLAVTLRAAWDLVPDLRMYVEAIHRLNGFGAVVTNRSHGTSGEGFDAEWRMILVLTVEGNRIKHFELFDEADIDAAVARLDELCVPARQLENAATRAREHGCDAYNRRDVEEFLALASGRYEDRRKGLRYEGASNRDFANAVLSETPTSWRLEFEPVAIRGDHLALSCEAFRDTSDAELPITVELIVLTDIADELAPYTVFFDPDDIDAAFHELTARWIASGEVAHPDVIKINCQVNEAYNRHDWDAVAALEAGAAYVNHRQLASADGETMTDHWSSIRALSKLIPDMRVEFSEILAASPMGCVNSAVVRGTSVEGAAIELAAVILLLFDGARVTRMEAFDLDQRDLALARFAELDTPASH